MKESLLKIELTENEADILNEVILIAGISIACRTPLVEPANKIYLDDILKVHRKIVLASRAG